MRIDLVTLFPELFDGFFATSLIGRAQTEGTISVRRRSPRDFGIGPHKSVDDTPYGGGSGMVMRADVLVDCIESLDADASDGVKARRILLTPQGARFDQRAANRLSKEPALLFICGRYEGFDERIRSYVDEEVSLGDFVMTGGEMAAMAVIDSVTRLLPKVLGNASSLDEESHGGSLLLEYPHYTRPAEFRGAGVPDVLKNGNHAHIETWRKRVALERTRDRRPDLFERAMNSNPSLADVLEPKPKRFRGPKIPDSEGSS